jgi:adenine deaminase
MSLSSRQLNAYVSTGIEANHEFFPDAENGFEEILREIRLGLFGKLRKKVLISDIVKSLKEIPDRQNILFVTDDVMADDLILNGHLDDVIRTAIRNGYDPVEAIQSATVYPAKHLRLFDRGSIAPGKLADISFLDDLDRFKVNRVYADGKLVAQKGKLVTHLPIFEFPSEAKKTVKLQRPDKDSFRIRVPKKDGRIKVRIITMHGSLTRFEIREVEVKDHVIQPGTATIAVLERYNKRASKTVGLIDKLGLKEGAIASTVAHDSHNLIVVGMTVDDMVVAVNELIDCQGELVAVRNGKVLARLELSVGGLMSEDKAETVGAKLLSFRKAEEDLGVIDYGTILTISTLALPVIAHARITDKGLIDVDKQEIVPLLVD